MPTCWVLRSEHQGRIVDNDVGDESVNAVTLLGARIGAQQQWGKARCSACLRGDNLSEKTTQARDRQRSEPQILRTGGGAELVGGVSLGLGW